MIEDKKIEEIKKIIPKLVEEGIILKKEEHKRLTDFFIRNAEESLNSAQLLYKVSIDTKLQNLVGFPNLKGFLWVINASYYSMFYMANALLASIGIKIKTEVGIHTLTFNAFVYHFYLTNKITKKYIEEFLEAMKEANELLGKEEQEKALKKAEVKAKDLVSDLYLEGEKRKIFTYEFEKTKIEIKAKTSLERANNFYKETLKLIR